LTSLVDRSWRERSRGKRETTTARAAKRLLGAPGGSVLGGEISFEGELERDDGGGGVVDDKGTGEVGDGVSEGGGDGGHFEGRLRRDVRERVWVCVSEVINRTAIEMKRESERWKERGEDEVVEGF
jgi:hypothetical protein